MKVQSDLGGVRDVSGRLKAANYEASAAVNQAARRTEDVSVQRISTRLNLRRLYVAGKFGVRRASPARPTAVVEGEDEPIQLRQYDARQEFNGGKKQGVTFQILKNGPRSRVERAFFLPLKRGQADGGNGMGVFIRTGSERKALRLLYGATPGQMFKLVTQDITPELERQIEAQILGMFTDRARVSFNTQVTRR